MAANTVLPSMFGKACRAVSRAMPEYDPALCPLILMCPSMGWSGPSLRSWDVETAPPTDTKAHYAHTKLATVASLAVISTASEHLHNGL